MGGGSEFFFVTYTFRANIYGRSYSVSRQLVVNGCRHYGVCLMKKKDQNKLLEDLMRLGTYELVAQKAEARTKRKISGDKVKRKQRAA